MVTKLNDQEVGEYIGKLIPFFELSKKLIKPKDYKKVIEPLMIEFTDILEEQNKHKKISDESNLKLRYLYGMSRGYYVNYIQPNLDDKLSWDEMFIK